MRRSDREVTEFTDMVSIIKKCDVCRLALNDVDYPYILPLNFGMNITEKMFWNCISMAQQKVQN